MFTSRDKFDELVECIKQLPAFAKGYKYPYINHYQFRHLRFVYMIHGEGKLKALKELSVYPARSEEYYFNIAYQAIENDMSEHLAGAMFLVSPGPIKRCIQILNNDPEIKVLYHPEPFPPHIHFPVIANCLPYVYYNKVGTDLTPTVHNELLYDTDIYNSLINKTVKAVPEEILIADEHFSQYRSLSPKMRQKALQAARNQGNESLVVPFALALSKGIALADLDASTIIEELNCCYLTNMNDESMDDGGSEQIEQNSTKLDSSNATVALQSQTSNAAPNGNNLDGSTQSKAATAIATKDTTAISNATPTAKDLAVASEAAPENKDNANNATSKATSANSSVATESNKGQQDNLSNNNSKGSIGNNKASGSGSSNVSDITSSDSSRDVGSDKAINNNRANGNDSGIKPSSTSQEAQGNSSTNNEQSSTKTTVAASNCTTVSVSQDASASEASADTTDKLEGDSANTVDNSSAKANNSASANVKQKVSNKSKAVSSSNVGNDSTTSNHSEAKPVAVIFQTFTGIDHVEKQAESSTNTTANDTIDSSTNDDDLAIEQELAAQEELEALYQSDYDDIDSDIDTDNEAPDFDEMLLEELPSTVEFTNGKPCTPIKDTTSNQESDASNEDDYGSCDSTDSVPSDATNKSAANSNDGDGETTESNTDIPEAENTESEIDEAILDPIARANMRASKLLAKCNLNDTDQSFKHGFDSNKLHVFGIGSQELNELLANTLQNKRKGITPNDLQALPKRFVILGGAKNNVLRAKNLSNYHVLAIFGKQDADYCNFCDQQDAKTKAQITKQNSQLRATLLQLLNINFQAPI